MTPQEQDLFKELVLTLAIITKDYQSIRSAYFSNPQKISDGDCPDIQSAKDILKRSEDIMKVVQSWPEQESLNPTGGGNGE